MILKKKTKKTVLILRAVTFRGVISLRSNAFVQAYNRRPGSHVYATPYGSYGVSNGVSNVGAGGWRFV